ncbi:MAG: LysR family transcriptional regulator [Oscillospiraceae bacterium]|nr:LysR family transcriptional regulator [Oscillospiraceae bacterium]
MKTVFIKAEEIASELGVSKPYAYKLIQKMNAELKVKGYITISGRVNRQYYEEKLYGSCKTN